MNGFLPISKQDMTDRGWYYCDFLIVTGDAYVDHPSFGTAIISRVLEDAGYKDGEITFEMGYDSSASANNQMVCQIIQQLFIHGLYKPHIYKRSGYARFLQLLMDLYCRLHHAADRKKRNLSASVYHFTLS